MPRSQGRSEPDKVPAEIQAAGQQYIRQRDQEIFSADQRLPARQQRHLFEKLIHSLEDAKARLAIL
jgi:hypothetical protein